MVRQGISSVSFRNAPPEEVIAAARGAGLEGIEWSGDTHAPPGDLQRAERIMMATLRSGLTVSAYGSFYRLTETADYAPILETARRLQAPAVRIWAGPPGSGDYAAKARDIADRSGKYGITVCLEGHPKSAAACYDELFSQVISIDHPFFKACWTPLPGSAMPEGISDPAELIHLVHARNWDAGFGRRSLEEAQPGLEHILRALCEKSRNAPLDYWTLIEYLDEEKPATLKREAASLRELISRYRLATPTSPKEPAEAGSPEKSP